MHFQCYSLPGKNYMYGEAIKRLRTNKICNLTFLSISQEGNAWMHQCSERINFNLSSIWLISHSLVLFKFLGFTGAVIFAWFLYNIFWRLCLVSIANKNLKGEGKKRDNFLQEQKQNVRDCGYEIYSFISLSISSVGVLVFCCTLWYFMRWEFCTPLFSQIHYSCCYPSQNCFTIIEKKSVLFHSQT